MHRDRGNRRLAARIASGHPVVLAGIAAAALAWAVGCTPSRTPPKPAVHPTRAFDEIYGELPPVPLQAPAWASVVYFPDAKDPGRYVTAPIFTTEPGKAEFLTMRTAVRGIAQKEFASGVSLPFPEGSDLASFRREGGRATIGLAGTVPSGTFSGKEGDRAAGGLFLTAKQFGEVSSIEIADASGKAVYRGEPPGGPVTGPGNPRALELLAIREEAGRPAGALSVLFDRPVFVEEIAFYPPEGDVPFSGNSYSTGFGMSVEFHPDRGIAFDSRQRYRIRFHVRDGKGRTTHGEIGRFPREVVRG